MTSIVAKFEIPFTQIIDATGNVVDNLPEFAKDPQILLSLYENMVRARVFDKKAIALQRTGKMGTYAPLNGQEAISTAIGNVMRKEDVFIPYYRDYAAQFQRGVKMSEILAYWGGDERGSNFVNNQEDLPICVPIASQCLHAAGVAFAFKYREEARVAVVCIGDGGTSEGDFYEAINVAGAWKLPVVFVVNNNKWAISVPREGQTAAQTIAQKAIGAGFSGVQVDGNDVIATRDIVCEAIQNARNGQGPTLIEALTYRLCDHTTADDATRYQPNDEVEKANKEEPITRFEHFLLKNNYLNLDTKEIIYNKAKDDVKKAVDEYLGTPTQDISTAFDYHYATIPDYLLEQKEQAKLEVNHD